MYMYERTTFLNIAKHGEITTNFNLPEPERNSNGTGIQFNLFMRSTGWLVGFYGTAAQYRLYSAGECSECENECACRVDWVVPPCTFEQWVNSPTPIPLGGRAVL